MTQDQSTGINQYGGDQPKVDRLHVTYCPASPGFLMKELYGNH